MSVIIHERIHLPSRRARGLWLRWIVASTLAETVGVGVPAITAFLLTRWNAPDFLVSPSNGTLALAVVAMLVAGAAEGALLGYAQSRVLPRTLPRIPRSAWITATSAGGAAAAAIGLLTAAFAHVEPRRVDLMALLLLSDVLAVALGCVLGLAQWVVLRGHVRRAGWWIPASGVAWLLGLAIAFSGASMVRSHFGLMPIVALAISVGALTGALVGIVTGAVLIYLARTTAFEEAPPG